MKKSRSALRGSRLKSNESGNVFLIIIMAIALLAALIFTMSRGMNEGTGSMSKKQAEMRASDILSYAQKLERGVARIQRRTISENEISFENSYVAGYVNASCVIDRCKVFEPAGGSIGWKTPSPDVNDGSEWVFTGANYIKGLGAVGDATDGELLALLPNVTAAVCQKINDKLGISGIPQENADSVVTKFQGTFIAAPKLIEEKGGGTALDGVRAACFEGDTSPAAGTYHFYYVLMQRP